jgi:hypothetical protein
MRLKSHPIQPTLMRDGAAVASATGGSPQRVAKAGGLFSAM